MKTPNSRQNGFTLVELMVTVGIAALLVGLAAPNFRTMTIRNRLSTYANEVITTINLARSEAVRRGLPVTICASEDAEECSGSWTDGWIVFIDPNSDGVRDPADATEILVRAYEGLAQNYSAGATASFDASVTYGSDGAASNTGVFVLCHDANTEGARAVIVTPLRPRVARDSNDDRIPNKDNGENIASCDNP